MSDICCEKCDFATWNELASGCKYRDCECHTKEAHTTESWEGPMYEMMTDMGQPERSQLLAAIKSLLASQRSSLKGIIEKKLATIRDAVPDEKPDAQTALSDVLSLLKED